MNNLTTAAVLALALMGSTTICAADLTPPPSATSAAPSSESSTPSIGIATMMPDGTIVLQLRGQADDGTVAETQLVIKPGDPTYASTLQHLGGLKPGETKPVPPWPDDPKK